MTRKEAISYFKGITDRADDEYDELVDASFRAIEALEYLEINKQTIDLINVFSESFKCDPNMIKLKDEWIPCSERLPEEKCDVLALFNWNMAVGCIYDGEWRINSGDNWCTPVLENEEKPIAWMKLPEPYKEESEDKE